MDDMAKKRRVKLFSSIGLAHSRDIENVPQEFDIGEQPDSSVISLISPVQSTNHISRGRASHTQQRYLPYMPLSKYILYTTWSKSLMAILLTPITLCLLSPATYPKVPYVLTLTSLSRRWRRFQKSVPCHDTKCLLLKPVWNIIIASKSKIVASQVLHALKNLACIL